MPFRIHSSKPTPIHRAPGWPENSSPLSSTSSSLSSTFSSTDMPPADSSQSDITSSDHAVSLPAGSGAPRHARGYDLALSADHHPRSSVLAAAMGQNYSKASSSAPFTSVGASSAQRGVAAAAVTGNKFKRVFGGGRRKNKSEDQPNTFVARRSSNEKRKHAEHRSSESSADSHPAATVPPREVFSGNKKARSSPTPQPPSPVPPPLPPKPQRLQVNKVASSSPTEQPTRSDHRGSIIPVSPGISSAVAYIRFGDEERPQASFTGAIEKDLRSPKESEADHAKDKDKDAWRKSDSAMSHHTIRPGAATTARSSRPVSMAESLQSTHTIVPDWPVNKRLSALMGDADFTVAEEDNDTSNMTQDQPLLVHLRSSPTSSLRSKNRRSMSLNLGPTQAKVQPSASPPQSASDSLEFRNPSKSLDNGTTPLMYPSREAPTLTRTAANGIIAPSSPGLQSTGNNIRGRLAAWTATTSSNNFSSRYDQEPHSPPPRHSPSPRPATQTPSLRQTAISMSNGFAPAAGLAKRAVEKMGRAWGGFSSGSSSGYTSSSSGTAPSSYHSDHGLSRTPSNQSGAVSSLGVKSKRRTPDAPSGAWSVSSIGTQSDSEAFSGPSLGVRIRGPLRGRSVAGVVFGRDLKSVVRETAIGVGVHNGRSWEGAGNALREDLKALEKRRLPAIVVRSAQHIMLWGVQEEGLFRLSGRHSHVAKLRSEFDTGADFDMQGCSPGELDPHAVASIFKAFLRELPEPILTHSLIPYFEEALSQENSVQAMETSSQPTRIGSRGPTLPSGPKNGLPAIRKPPSLSTLAMPNLSGMRPPSRSLINALQALIAQLPEENRDLLRTVTDLIKATSKNHKATKMPLSNLLLVFCPSLNMNPPLLRVLCEADRIWEVDQLIDIGRGGTEVVLDITPKGPSIANTHISSVGADTEDGEEVSAADDGTVPSVPASGPLNEEQTRTELPSSPPTAPHRPSQEDEIKRRNVVRPRPLGPRRAHVPAALINDVDPNISMTSVNSASMPSAYYTATSDSMCQDDDTSAASPSEGHSVHSRVDTCSPAFLSSSAESLATPSSSSTAPSFDHLPLEKDELNKGSPLIVESTADLSLPTPRRQYLSAPISSPIQFPTTSDSALITTLSPKRSAPLLTLPASSPPTSPQGSASSAPSSPLRRLKKPSLQLLFKRSSSSLTAATSGIPFISAPRNNSDSSVSTPLSTVTAPQSSTYVLDTAIESSPLHLGRELGLESPRRESYVVTPSNKDHMDLKEDIAEKPHDFYQLGETPIADRYRAPSVSSVSLLFNDEPAPSHLRPHPTFRNRSTSNSSESSNHLGLLDDDDHEDWTKSVLMAADEWNKASSSSSKS